MSSLFILILLALVCFIVNVVIIKTFIPILKRLRFGQSIRTEGPKKHLVKNGTPTLGGIFIILNTILFYIVARIILKDEFSTTSIINEILIFIPFIGYGIIGLIDDLLTIKKKQNEGLTPRKKFILELIIFSFPTSIISDSISLIALIAPFMVASGALSPPIASKIIFIK